MKAMVVTSSQLHAVRYKQNIDNHIKEKGHSDIKTLVAFVRSISRVSPASASGLAPEGGGLSGAGEPDASYDRPGAGGAGQRESVLQVVRALDARRERAAAAGGV